MSDERLGAVRRMPVAYVDEETSGRVDVDENEIHAMGEKSVHEPLAVDGEMSKSRAVVEGGGGLVAG